MKEKIQPRQPNCIGFVYSRLGIIPEETFIKPPGLLSLLETFDIVEDIRKAKVLGVILFASHGPILAHMALLDDDKKNVIHRKGEGEAVIIETVNECLREYENDFGMTQVLLFAPRNKVPSTK